MFLYSISAGSGLISFTLMLLISFWTTSGVKLLLFYYFNFYVFNNFVRHCFSLFLQFLPHYQATKAEFDNLAHRCQSYKVISHLTNWILCYFFTEDRTMGLHVDLEKVVKVQISLKGWGLRYIRRCWYAIDSHLGSLTMIRKIIWKETTSVSVNFWKFYIMRSKN